MAPNGVLVAEKTRSGPRIAPDGAGGAIVTWTYPVNIVPPSPYCDLADQIRAQRLTGRGATPWGTAGLTLAVPPNCYWYYVRDIGPDTDGAYITYGTNWYHSNTIGRWNAAYIPRSGAAGVYTTLCSNCYFALTPSEGNGALTAWLAWSELPPSSIYARRLWGSGGSAQLLETLQCRAPVSIVSDGQDGAIVARPGQVRRIDGNQQLIWSRTLCVCTAGSYVIASDGSGGAFLAWQDQRLDSGDIALIRMDSSGSIPAGWLVDGLRVLAGSGTQRTPAIVSDGHGGVFVTCADSEGKARLTLIDGAGNRAPGWEESGKVLSATAVVSGSAAPGLAADGDGGAFIVWPDTRKGATNLDIFATHLQSGGQPAAGWSAGGNPICSASGNQSSPVVAAVGATSAITAWMDARSGSNQVYATRLDDAIPLAVTSGPASPDEGPRVLRAMAESGARSFQLSIRWPREAPASVEIVDVAGHRLLSQPLGALGAGVHDVRVEVGRRLVAGIYWIRLTQGSHTGAARSLVLH